ncbi:hypothetical protein ABB37_09097 [Leptomonas pyrrhocoris]|uniref:Uncharacterized protein n=1 Tax=Leptomonas pyrrhocoris TaxID=157538 RepID=A0A0N0DRE9_LEPPY|nr:hypothetical protein ABB37_09097 [Leptomonas pyrrhocoris]KPA74391.1 hypothetical protein ABB37_09097 [Leptomonas pyrrhocoris]|eukprot:XP_015652830.1 hypothetical protein ABB37_09097 [Leptomonas pyrrhocoris]
MTSVTTPTAPTVAPFLRQLQRIADRLESFSAIQEAKILSRRSSTSSATDPAESASTAGTPPQAPSSAIRSHQRRRDSSDSTGANENANEGPTLRRRHGRLYVRPEEYDSLPQALPTVNFYGLFPRAVGPIANVVVTSPDEYQALLDTCEPVEVVKSSRDRDVRRNRLCKVDIHQGGFFVYQPQGRKPQYFKLRCAEESSDVYGSATYIHA